MNKAVLFIILLCLFLPTINLFTVGAKAVTWENQYGKLEVYPDVSREILTQKQYYEVTWYYPSTSLDIAFRFNYSLSYGGVYSFNGETYIKKECSHIEYNDKHYYVLENIHFNQDETKTGYWEYNTPVNSSGKWDLFIKLSSDTWEYAFNNNRIIHLDPWWNSNYEYFKIITIDDDFIDDTLTDFPVLVVIDDATADKCNGGDSINFLNMDNSTEYYYEIEKWVDNEDRLIWVKIPSVSSSVDTQFLMYYGNSGASDNQDKNNVWNSDYLGVWHMNDSSGGIIDSTSNANSGVETGDPTYEQTGQIDYSIDFDGTGDLFAFETLDVSGDDTFTWEFWFKDNSVGDGVRRWLTTTAGSFGTTNILIREQSGEILLLTCGDSSTSSGASWKGAWHYFHMVSDGSTGELFQDLVSVVSTASTGNPTAGFYVGGGDIGESAEFSDSLIDEVRISTVVRTNAWLKASYHSQKQTGGFITFGSEQVQNIPPIISNEIPLHESIDISLQPTVNVTITDNDGDTSTCDFYTSTDNITYIWRQTNTSVLNESIQYNYIQANDYSTLYYFKITANDTEDNVTAIYNFTTVEYINAPVISDIEPLNNSIDITLFPVLSFTVVHPEGLIMNITYLSNVSGSWQIIGDELTTVNNGTYYQRFSEFGIYGLTYYWNISVTSATGNIISDTFSYTSESIPTTGNGEDYGEIGLFGIFGFIGFVIAIKKLKSKK